MSQPKPNAKRRLRNAFNPLGIAVAAASALDLETLTEGHWSRTNLTKKDSTDKTAEAPVIDLDDAFPTAHNDNVEVISAIIQTGRVTTIKIKRKKGAPETSRKLPKVSKESGEQEVLGVEEGEGQSTGSLASSDALADSPLEKGRLAQQTPLERSSPNLDNVLTIYDDDDDSCDANWVDVGSTDASEAIRLQGCPGLKAWLGRNWLFSRFDEGIQMDEAAWWETTPELIGKHLSRRISMLIEELKSARVLVGCCGVGGEVCHLTKILDLNPSATRCEVVAVDSDPLRIAACKNNARVYGVEDNRVQFFCETLEDHADRILPQETEEQTRVTFEDVEVVDRRGFRMHEKVRREEKVYYYDWAIVDFPWGGRRPSKNAAGGKQKSADKGRSSTMVASKGDEVIASGSGEGVQGKVGESKERKDGEFRGRKVGEKGEVEQDEEDGILREDGEAEGLDRGGPEKDERKNEGGSGKDETTEGQSLDGEDEIFLLNKNYLKILKKISKISKNLILKLPRNFNVSQIIHFARYGFLSPNQDWLNDSRLNPIGYSFLEIEAVTNRTDRKPLMIFLYLSRDDSILRKSPVPTSRLATPLGISFPIINLPPAQKYFIDAATAPSTTRKSLPIIAVPEDLLKKIQPGESASFYDPLICNFLLLYLGEPAGQIPIMRFLFGLLGTDRFLWLVAETIRIERQGGLKQRNAEAQRTKGGIFFELLKQTFKPQYKILNKWRRKKLESLKLEKKDSQVTEAPFTEDIPSTCIHTPESEEEEGQVEEEQKPESEAEEGQTGSDDESDED